jgi:hypothetical protein
MRGFRAVRVPVDVDAGEVRLRLEVEGREPIRFTSRWREEKQPEPVLAPKPEGANRTRKTWPAPTRP